jgi:hypothetical protein
MKKLILIVFVCQSSICVLCWTRYWLKNPIMFSTSCALCLWKCIKCRLKAFFSAFKSWILNFNEIFLERKIFSENLIYSQFNRCFWQLASTISLTLIINFEIIVMLFCRKLNRLSTSLTIYVEKKVLKNRLNSILYIASVVFVLKWRSAFNQNWYRISCTKMIKFVWFFIYAVSLLIKFPMKSIELLVDCESNVNWM